jgi:hypothetical protein
VVDDLAAVELSVAGGDAVADLADRMLEELIVPAI